jgi:pyrroline-5-carboxylate reductase
VAAERVGIIGGSGWLGFAIAQSLISSGAVDPARLMCSYRSRRPSTPIDCLWTRDNDELVAASDIVIVSVQPADWPSLAIKAGDRLLVSVMAGVTLEDLRRRTGARRLARALPNAAAKAGASYTPVFMMSEIPADADKVRGIFEACGTVDMVIDEDHIDYFTGMSGSGPAFPALLAEAMMRDAIGRGISADIARRAALQTLIGAARTFDLNETNPTEIVRAFVDYGGTTAAAIQTMRDRGFAAAVEAGLEAAHAKAKALSRG